MSNGWAPKDLTLDTTGTALLASTANQAVSKENGLSAGGACQALILAIDAASVSGTVPVRLQQSFGVNSSGVDVWEDVSGKSVSVANGRNYIRFSSSSDAALVPLYAKIRLVSTTGGGASATITKVLMLQTL